MNMFKLCNSDYWFIFRMNFFYNTFMFQCFTTRLDLYRLDYPVRGLVITECVNSLKSVISLLSVLQRAWPSLHDSQFSASLPLSIGLDSRDPCTPPPFPCQTHVHHSPCKPPPPTPVEWLSSAGQVGRLPQTNQMTVRWWAIRPECCTEGSTAVIWHQSKSELITIKNISLTLCLLKVSLHFSSMLNDHFTQKWKITDLSSCRFKLVWLSFSFIHGTQK